MHGFSGSGPVPLNGCTPRGTRKDQEGSKLRALCFLVLVDWSIGVAGLPGLIR